MVRTLYERIFDQSLTVNKAFPTFLLAMGIACGFIWQFGPQSLTFIYRRWLGFTTAALIMSVVQGILCYAFSFTGNKLLALGGNTGNPIYDVSMVRCPLYSDAYPSFIQFFIGRELNPSIGSFDLKSFNELRPGLILWALVDVSIACEQAVRRGGTPTDSMMLVLLFQLLYIADALYNEVRIPPTPSAALS